MRLGKAAARRRASVAGVLVQRGQRLRCRDCRAYCPTDKAIREARGRSRCPACGGVLDREPPNGKG